MHTVFEKEAECFVIIESFDVKLGVEMGKKGSTVGINSGQVSYRNTENVNRGKIVIYLKGQPLYTYLLSLQSYRFKYAHMVTS